MNEGQRFDRRSFDRTNTFLLIGLAIVVHILCETDNLEWFRTTTLDWYASFWSWYQHMIAVHPSETFFVTIQIAVGVIVYLTLRRGIPTWGQAMTAGLKLRDYFWVRTFFWLAIFVELPVAIALIIHEVPIWVHAIPHAVLLLLIAMLYARLAGRETFNDGRFRKFFTPVFSLIAPGVGALYRLQSVKFLPPEVSRIIDWIIDVYPSLLLAPL